MNFVLLAVFSVVMCLTRFPVPGISFHLLDASWVLFFLLGRLAFSPVKRLAGFTWLTLLGWCIDFLATQSGGVSDYCMTPAYIGMPIAYAALVWFGTLSSQVPNQKPLIAATSLVAIASLGAVVAFIITNLFFFVGSGYFEGMTAADYAAAVMQYLPNYIFVMQIYLLAWFLGNQFLSLELFVNTRLSAQA